VKLVKEHINFERGLDPKDAMGTGRNAMSDEYKIDNAENIFMDAFPDLDISFKEDFNNHGSYYARISGNPTLLTDMQLLYNSKDSDYEPGFCLYDNDGGELYVPEKPLYFDMQPIITAMHNYISKYGFWNDEKKYINDKYVK